MPFVAPVPSRSAKGAGVALPPLPFPSLLSLPDFAILSAGISCLLDVEREVDAGSSCDRTSGQEEKAKAVTSSLSLQIQSSQFMAPTQAGV